MLNQLQSGGTLGRTIIFAATKRRCERVNSFLNRMGVRAVVMHGDKTQQERESALKRFRNNQSSVLVATDVCARGLDVDGIETVINYDFCQSVEDYVHRIGRTGRSNNKGQAYTFFTENDRRHAADLINVLQEAKQYLDPQLQKWGSRGSRQFNGPQKSMRYGTFKTPAIPKYNKNHNQFGDRKNDQRNKAHIHFDE